MENLRSRRRGWQDGHQDQNVTLPCASTSRGEEEEGTPSADVETPSSAQPTLRIPSSLVDSGPQEQQRAASINTRRNLRNLGYSKWTVAEKEILHYCAEYSRYEKWSGRRRGVILEERMEKSELPPDKKGTPLPKIRSLLSQVHKYVKEERLRSIEEEAVRDAERDYREREKNEAAVQAVTDWTKEEKWILVWSMKYAEAKFIRQREKTAEWRRIFFHFCTNKSSVPPGRLTTRKSNILTSKVFKDSEITYMESEIEMRIELNNDILEHPIVMPAIESSNELAAAQPDDPPPSRRHQVRPVAVNQITTHYQPLCHHHHLQQILNKYHWKLSSLIS